MNIVTLAEEEISAGWTWVKTEAAALYHAVSPIVADALKAFETSVVQTLWGAAAALVQRLMHITSLVDLETALMNTLQLVAGPIAKAAESLGSAVLQSILGLLQARVRSAA